MQRPVYMKHMAGSVSTGPLRVFTPLLRQSLLQRGCFHGLAFRSASCQADTSHSQLSCYSGNSHLPSVSTGETEMPGGASGH